MTSLGTIFLPQFPPERLRATARIAEESGLDELWLWEDCFSESGIAAAAAALAWTTRIRVGVGLLPVPLRNVALTAMEVATLHRLFPDRVLVGVGHGVQEWMAQVGARVASPLTLLREYLGALRALLRGERISVGGRYVRLDDVELDWPPLTAPPVYVGAIGPRSLRLSGECADGTILPGGTTTDQVRQARAAVDRGRAGGGRTDPHPFVVYLPTATGPDAGDRVARELARPGCDPSSGVAGDAAEVAAAVRRWADSGADTVVLQPTHDDPDPEGFVRFLGEQVRPLLT